MIFWNRPVLAVLSFIPMVCQKASNVRKARRPTFCGARDLKSSTYPVNGPPKILLNRTAWWRKKKL